MFVVCFWVAAGLCEAPLGCMELPLHAFSITKCEAGASHNPGRASHSPAPTPLNTLSASSYSPLPYQPPHPPQ